MIGAQDKLAEALRAVLDDSMLEGISTPSLAAAEEILQALAAEKRAAQAGVTDEAARVAGNAIATKFAEGFFDDRMVLECGRAALEAVWPGKDAQDAKRYRWLRAWGIRLPEGARCYAQAALDNLVDGNIPIDAAIDAAMETSHG